MNWVEKRYQREQAIGSRAPKVWTELCLNLKECVESYGKRYGAGSKVFDPVDCNATSGSIIIRKAVSGSEPKRSQFAGESTITVTLEWDNYPRIVAITRIARKPGSLGTMNLPSTPVTTEFPLDADQDGVFMTDAHGKMDIDRASEKILEGFLFD
jgi:hypothetical protein